MLRIKDSDRRTLREKSTWFSCFSQLLKNDRDRHNDNCDLRNEESHAESLNFILKVLFDAFRVHDISRAE